MGTQLSSMSRILDKLASFRRTKAQQTKPPLLKRHRRSGYGLSAPMLAALAAVLTTLPHEGRCQVSTLVKPVLVPIMKKVVGDVAVQAGTDAVVTTGISSAVSGTFSPAISDPQFESVPKVFEYIPVTAELIDVATIVQGIWEINTTYIAMEEERRSRAAVDRMIKQMQATAYDRAKRMRIDRAAWFRAHLQRLIDANLLYNAAKTEQERAAALAQINAIMAYARRLAIEVGIHNVDLSVLTPAQAQTIAVKFFEFDLVGGKPITK